MSNGAALDAALLGAPFQTYTTRVGNAYTADSLGLIRSVAGADVTDLLDAGCILSGAGSALLGFFSALNMNSTADQPLTLSLASSQYYFLRGIIARNASISLTTAVGGIYTAASKGGSAVVAATQAYSGLTGPTLSVALTLAAAGQVLLSATPLYLSLTTPQGAAATMDLLVLGDPIP
jgi:hypothetical protein